MSGLLLYLIIFIFLPMPLWISKVSTRSWSIQTKKITMMVMTAMALAFAIYVFLKAYSGPTQLSVVAGQVSAVVYFMIFVIALYFSWPRFSIKEQLVSSGKSIMLHKKYFVVPQITGTYKGVTFTFIDATFEKVNDTLLRYPAPDFGAWLIEQIYEKKKILTLADGFFEKVFSCPSCKTVLNPGLAKIRQIEFELKFMDFDPFVVQITFNSLVCSKCNKVSGFDLDGSLTYSVNEAIIAAFESKNIQS